MQTFTSHSPPSDSNKPAIIVGNNNEDEAVINLASNNPKKRAGRRKFKETRHPVYRGVRRRNSRWVCEVREPRGNSRIWLGTYPTLEMAARAHDVAAIALRGRSACLNFADSAWRLPVPASSDRSDIRRAAAEAAEAFRPSKKAEESPENGELSMDDDENCSNTQTSTSSDDHDQENMSTLQILSNDHATIDESPENTQMSNDDRQENMSTLMMMDDDAIANVDYDDDEALFGMHGFLSDMAEGLMLEPPPQFINDDDVDIDADVSLWAFN